MSGKGNRDNAISDWFNPAKEQDDRTGRSGDGGSGTPRTPRKIQRRSEESLKRSEDSKGKSISSSNEEGGDVVAVMEENLKRSEDIKGKGIALSGGSSKGVGGDVGSSRGGERDTSSNIAEKGVMTGTTRSERHHFGDVSAAVIQANIILEDFSQVELGRTATFVGIYDGHGGAEAASFVSQTLTRELMGCIRHTGTMSADTLREAFLRTEASWLDRVVDRFEEDPSIAGYGTCCLVGVFWRRKLYIANAGDSRVVIARAKEGSAAKFDAVPLTRDDNVKDSVVRAELLGLHPHEPGFVVHDAQNEDVFRIKGRIQVSKSIGDAYLKRRRFNINHIARFRINSPVRDENPALSADPATHTISIGPQDRFVIFASAGLWEMLTNEEAVRIVQEFPKEGIAERLVINALNKAAQNIGKTSYKDVVLLRIENGHRRKAHDDISVVVIFLEHNVISRSMDRQENFHRHLIKQGSLSLEGDSSFAALDEVALGPPEARTLHLRHLPYRTSFKTLYGLVSSAAIQMLKTGRFGFSSKIVFFEKEDALKFVSANRNLLIMKGKLVCISFLWEKRYRRAFDVVDHMRSCEESPLTVQISNLTDKLITEEILATFFIALGLQLRNLPILLRKRQRRVYALVTFKTVSDCMIALEVCNGLLLLEHRIEIIPRPRPILELYPDDMNPNNPQ